jgi:hypothetical protein
MTIKKQITEKKLNYIFGYVLEPKIESDNCKKIKYVF